MDWLSLDVPPIWQWVGFFATIVGTGMALWAALSAIGARTKAVEARDAAIALGNVLHLSDLLQDAQELQAILARKDFEGLATKAGSVRGRTERFRQQQLQYGLSTADTAAALDMARDQLEIIEKTATKWTGKEENRAAKVQRAVNDVYVELSKAFGIQHASLDDKGPKP